MPCAYTSTDVKRWALIILKFHTASQTNLLIENSVPAFPPTATLLIMIGATPITQVFIVDIRMIFVQKKLN